MKAIAYIGALRYLEETGRMAGVTRYAGSSAGALMAAAVACGRTSAELGDLVMGLDFGRLQDRRACACPLWPWRRGGRWGLDTGEGVRRWVDEHVLPRPGYTFGDLWRDRGRVLVLTGACVNQRRLHLYHHESNPDMPIADAVRISIGLPYVFEAVIWGEDVLIDGGTYNNYPIRVFDTPRLANTRAGDRVETPTSSTSPDRTVLGLKLLDPDERPGVLWSGNDRVKTFVDFTRTLVYSLQQQLEKAQVGDAQSYWGRTVHIDTPPGLDDVLAFDLTVEERARLIEAGYTSTCAWFHAPRHRSASSS